MFFKPSSERECYAKLLGGCSGPLTREHVFTSGVMGGVGMVAFRGMSKIPDDKPVGLAGAAPRILCSTHNGNLSVLDSEAIKLSTALGDFHAASSGRFEVTIDGLLLERWLLKVTLGFLASGETSLGKRYPASRTIVAALFGKAAIVQPLGLYGMVGVDRHAQHTTEVLFRELTVLDPSGAMRLVGSFVAVHGLPLLLFLGGPFQIDEFLHRPDGTSYLDPYDCSSARTSYHPREMRLSAPVNKELVVTFQWT